MTSHKLLAWFDQDEALLETHHNGIAALGEGDDRPPEKFGKGDIGVLNYALTLEHLEAGFYNEATKLGIAKTPGSQAFLKQVTADENAHVAFFSKALGSKALAAPKLDFGSSLRERSELAEGLDGAREHRGRGLRRNKPAPSNISPDGAFDKPMSAAEVLKVVEGTGFIV